MQPIVAMTLADFVLAHTERGECACGECIDRGDKPEPTGHTVDMVFFKVALRGDEPITSMRDQFKTLTASWPAEFQEADPFDGQPHNYMELGGWLGDQGLALQYMAFGTLLGAFNLATPRSLFGEDADEQMVQHMAGMGLLHIAASRGDSDGATI